MAAQKPLDSHQRELVNIVKAAHRTLGLARDTRQAEQTRRLQEAKIAHAREWDQIEYSIRDDIEREIAAHASNLDEALIAAYNEGVPIRRIALDGFGNQFDGGVAQKINKLRSDDRVGNRHGHQRNTTDGGATEVAFPKPIDVESVLAEAMETEPPVFTAIGRHVLFEATERSEEMAVDNAVLVTMDPRDPYFSAIQDQASFSADRKATEVILYENPYRPEELRAPGLNLDPKERWMNPVAFWVAEHPQEARAGFDAAVAAAK